MVSEGSTMKALRRLGFTDRQPDFAKSKLGYDMGGWEISAQEMTNRSLVPIVQISGVLSNPNKISIIDIEMLQTFDDARLVAAFLVFGMQRHKNDLGSLPEWWSLGSANLDLHPVVQERKERKARMAKWRARPHCVLQIEHARLFRTQLRDLLRQIKATEIAEMYFDGGVLQVRVAGARVSSIAHGDPWEAPVFWPIDPTVKLPSRFMNSDVTLGFLDGTVDFDRNRYSGAYQNL